MIKEFKKFIARGNVIDLAVGVIMGAAFGKIVSSLVDNILMPIVGIFVGGIDFTNLSISFRSATINYGIFIQNVIDFIIIAFCIFLMVKITNKFLMKEEKKEEKKEIKKSEEVLLLEEIRDALVQKKKESNKAKKK